MTVLTAHWHHDILALTAREIISRVDAASLPEVRILMPNRRSCIAMREAFASISEGKTMLLPRIVPLANIEQELLMSIARHQENLAHLLHDIPPSMSRWQQRLLLVDLVRVFEKKRTGLEPSFQHSLALVDDLIDIHASLLRESVAIEAIDIQSIAHANIAAHWQMNAQFLQILFREWPFIERNSGMITAAAREQRVLAAIADMWSRTPPPYPVWMVGSTGSMPIVRTLMSVIHQMNQGFVVLPGLDLSTDEDVPIGHGQYYLKAALRAMKIGTSKVELLGDVAIASRQKLWTGHSVSDAHNIEIIECAHEEEEAGIISLIVREALKFPNKQVAVVTPNSALTYRIVLHLRRFDIHVSTPQGRPLSHMKVGQLWSRILQCLREDVSTLALIDLLHFSEVNCGVEPREWSDFLRDWRQLCRGVLSSIPASKRIHKLEAKHSSAKQIMALVAQLENTVRETMTICDWLSRLSELAHTLAPKRLEGQELMEQLIEQLAQASNHQSLDVYDIVDLLEEALLQPVRMPDISAHPRVSVLSPMEARLQQFDRVILAGFNEGDWPQTYRPSPWLNLAQGERLAMTPPDAVVTLAAHDIQLLGMAPELFITRSEVSAGSPTTPSRFLIKLQTQLERCGVTVSTQPWKQWWHALHDVTRKPLVADAPSPPVDMRPRSMRVTSLRHLFSDPYAIYAEYVLGLRELEPFDKMPDAATFGSLIHRLIEAMLREEKSADDNAWLLAQVEHLDADPRLYSLWLPRIRNILRFVAAMHAERKFTAIEMETKKEVNIGDITLVGKIDRLEKQGAAYSIHDYKTGDAPTNKEMNLGLEPQLIAYALMLSHDTGVLPEQLLYWALPKARQDGELVEYMLGEASLEEHINSLKHALGRLFEEQYRFYALNANSPYAGVSRNDECAA